MKGEAYKLNPFFRSSSPSMRHACCCPIMTIFVLCIEFFYSFFRLFLFFKNKNIKMWNIFMLFSAFSYFWQHINHGSTFLLFSSFCFSLRYKRKHGYFYTFRFLIFFLPVKFYCICLVTWLRNYAGFFWIQFSYSKLNSNLHFTFVLLLFIYDYPDRKGILKLIW